MAYGPMTSWQIDGETMEIVRDFIFLGFKITADGDCSREIKRCLTLWRKAVANLDYILKNRNYFAYKGLSGQRYVFFFFFPVVMYRCESWTIKKAKCWRIDAFDLWYCRRLLRVPWTARRSNQSILNRKSVLDINWKDLLMLKLKL